MIAHVREVSNNNNNNGAKLLSDIARDLLLLFTTAEI